MDSNRVIEGAIRQAQDILWAAVPPGRSRDAALDDIRGLLWSPGVNSALCSSSDTLVAFALREAQRAVADRSRNAAATIDLLWTVLDEPSLNAAIGISRSSHMKVGRGHPPRR